VGCKSIARCQKITNRPRGISSSLGPTPLAIFAKPDHHADLEISRINLFDALQKPQGNGKFARPDVTEEIEPGTVFQIID